MYSLLKQINKKELIFYAIVLVIAIILEYLNIADIQKVIAIGILAFILRFVMKTLFFGTCKRCEQKDD